MTDRDSNKIDLENIPPPSTGAQITAVNLALAAYDEEFSKSSSKGNSGAGRLMTILKRNSQEWSMKRIYAYGLASAILLPIAGVATFHQLQRTPLFETTEQSVDSLDADQVRSLNRVQTGGKKLPKEDDRSIQNVPASAGRSETRVATIDNKREAEKKAKPVPHSLKLGLNTTASESVIRRPNSLASKQLNLQPSQNSGGGGLGGIMNMYSPPSHSQGYRRKDQIRPKLPSRDRFTRFESNEVKSVVQNPVSTFSIDVDTTSYSFVRRQILAGSLPTKNQVRVEELINYFPYDYERPDNLDAPFKANLALYPTPWNEHTKLLHIGLQGYDIDVVEKPRSNLVFLIDVSGSMSSPDKLPLLVNAFRLLVDQLRPEDKVSIVTYAGKAGTVLEPTDVRDKAKILSALGSLRSGGSTAGAQGIQQAYNLAKSVYIKDGVNRVILATDGDFNVGISDVNSLKTLIKQQRKSGIYLSVLGFGQGNYNDALMQVLAQNGNGKASYIDNLREAQKVLVDEASSTLFPIANDVKIQIEFNPQLVSEYRLIGYETRHLKRQDFNNDKVDAGDIGSGHTVTAIYEIVPKDSQVKLIDDLRYKPTKKDNSKKDNSEVTTNISRDDEYAFLKIRYKKPESKTSQLITIPVTRNLETDDIQQLAKDIQFSTSVAAFGQKLRGITYTDGYSYDEILSLAKSSLGDDKYGYRSEFLGLVRLANSLEQSKTPRISQPKQ